MSYFSNLSAVQITFAMRGISKKLPRKTLFKAVRVLPRHKQDAPSRVRRLQPLPLEPRRVHLRRLHARFARRRTRRVFFNIYRRPRGGWTPRGGALTFPREISTRGGPRRTQRRRGSAARVSSAPPRFSERRGSSTISVRSVGTWTTSATRTRRSSPCPRRRMGPHQRPSAKRTRGAMPTPPRFTPPSPTASTMPSPPERFP